MLKELKKTTPKKNPPPQGWSSSFRQREGRGLCKKEGRTSLAYTGNHTSIEKKRETDYDARGPIAAPKNHLTERKGRCSKKEISEPTLFGL